MTLQTLLGIELPIIQAPMAGVQTSVEVSASSAAIDTEGSTLGGVVNEAAIRGLPLSSRNYTQILGLSPGVIADPIRHSISPAVHNRGFQARRIDAVYLPFLVSPLQLRDFFRSDRDARR